MGTGGNWMERGKDGKLDLTEGVSSSGFDFGIMHKQTLLCALTLFTPCHILVITLEQFIKILLISLHSCIVLQGTDVLYSLHSIPVPSLQKTGLSPGSCYLLQTVPSFIASCLGYGLFLSVYLCEWSWEEGLLCQRSQHMYFCWIFQIPDPFFGGYTFFCFPTRMREHVSSSIGSSTKYLFQFLDFLSIWPGEKVSWL